MTVQKIFAAMMVVAIAAGGSAITVASADAKAKVVAQKTTPLICVFLPFLCKKEGKNTVLR